MDREPRMLVVAIDFGTTYSGYAFSFLSDFKTNPTKVFTANFKVGSMQMPKMPTSVLFSPDGWFHSFGSEAEEKYAKLFDDDRKEAGRWYFFERFKLKLHNNKIPTQYQLPPELPPSPDEAELETRNDAAKRRREAACEKAMANQAKAHQRQGKAFLKRKNIGAKPCLFAVGQMVYFAVPIRQGSRKMKDKWLGPERIVSIEKGKLQLANGKTVAREQCKPHLTSALHDVSALSLDHQQSTSVSSLALDHPYAAHHNDRQCPFAPSTADQSSGQHEFKPTSDIPKALSETGRKDLTCPGGITVTLGNLETLAGKNWLDDKIIDGFLGIAVQEKNAVVFPSHLAIVLASRDPASGYFQTQIQMSTVEWLLFPVCEFHHWFLFAVNIPCKQVHILDSLPQEKRKQRCRQIWKTFLQRRAERVPNDLPMEGWELGPLTSEVQKGGDDCGVYVCMNGESMVNHGYPAQGVQPSAAARHHIFSTIVAVRDPESCCTPLPTRSLSIP